MAINGGTRFLIQHDEVFPKGALAMSVSPVENFQTKTQERDKVTGDLLWAVTVIDQAAERKNDAVVTVKIAAPHQPVPPEAIPGTDVRPVIFEGLTVTPWVDDKACRPGPAGEKHRCRARLSFSLRAKGMKSALTKSPAKGATEKPAA